MKLYSYYTSSHEVLLNDWFLPSVGDEYEIILNRFEQECETGEYFSDGWAKTVSNKFDVLIEATKENWGNVFVFSDVDIQFFRPTKEILIRCIQEKDIVFQKNSPNGYVCTGFFVCRGNEKIMNLWKDAKKKIKKYTSSKGYMRDDQDIINDLLHISSLSFGTNIRIARTILKHIQKLIETRPIDSSKVDNPYEIRWGYLPIEFFGGGSLTGKTWKQGLPLDVPTDIAMHHANFVIGIDDKIKQLAYVKKHVDRLSANKRLVRSSAPMSIAK